MTSFFCGGMNHVHTNITCNGQAVLSFFITYNTNVWEDNFYIRIQQNERGYAELCSSCYAHDGDICAICAKTLSPTQKFPQSSNVTGSWFCWSWLSLWCLTHIAENIKKYIQQFPVWMELVGLFLQLWIRSALWSFNRLTILGIKWCCINSLWDFP